MKKLAVHIIKWIFFGTILFAIVSAIQQFNTSGILSMILVIGLIIQIIRTIFRIIYLMISILFLLLIISLLIL